MTTKNFPALMADICRLAQVGDPERFQKDAHLDVDGITFTLLEGTHGDAGTVIYFCDFGFPPGGEERAEALQRLLEMNLVMYGIGAPSFSLNYENGHVLLMGTALLSMVDAEKLLNSFAQYALEAKRWRNDYFLESSGKSKRKTQPRLPGAFAR